MHTLLDAWRCRNSSAVEFLFVRRREESCCSVDHTFAGTCASLATITTLMQVAPVPVVNMACIPVIIPFTTPTAGIGWPLTEKAANLRLALNISSSAQFCVAVVETISGNFLSGLTNLTMSTLGMYSCTPGNYSFLPTYAVCSFINGSVACITVYEVFHHLKTPMFTAKMGFVYNLSHIFVITNPIFSFVGGALAYLFLSELREIATQQQDFEGLVDPMASQAFSAFSGAGHTLAHEQASPRFATTFPGAAYSLSESSESSLEPGFMEDLDDTSIPQINLPSGEVVS